MSVSGNMIICDDCGESDVADAHMRGERAIRDAFKAEGWRCFPRDGGYADSCPSCVRAWAQNGARKGKGQKHHGQGRLI